MKKKKPDPELIDDENPEWTREMFREARPAIDVFTELWGKEKAEAFVYKGRGRPQKAVRKISTTLRLDGDVLKAFRARGKGWQSQINQALKDWVATHPTA
jgi:uncharacterized protein (DUF4415 family)